MLEDTPNIDLFSNSFMAMNEVISSLENVIDFLEYLNELRAEIIENKKRLAIVSKAPETIFPIKHPQISL